MNMRARRYGALAPALAIVCLLVACKGRQEPVKPIAATPLVCFIDY